MNIRWILPMLIMSACVAGEKIASLLTFQKQLQLFPSNEAPQSLSEWVQRYGDVDVTKLEKNAPKISVDDGANNYILPSEKAIRYQVKTQLGGATGPTVSPSVYIAATAIGKPTFKSANIFCWGSLNGDIRNFVRDLDSLRQKKIIDNNLKLKDDVYFVFCGNLTHYEPYSFEVVVLLCQLYLINPHQVRIIRGVSNIRALLPSAITYSVERDEAELTTLSVFDSSLPVAEFFSIRTISPAGSLERVLMQFCSGGFEFYDSNQMKNKLKDERWRRSYLKVESKNIQDFFEKNKERFKKDITDLPKDYLAFPGRGFIENTFNGDELGSKINSTFSSFIFGRLALLAFFSLFQEPSPLLYVVCAAHASDPQKVLKSPGGIYQLTQGIFSTIKINSSAAQPAFSDRGFLEISINNPDERKWEWIVRGKKVAKPGPEPTKPAAAPAKPQPQKPLVYPKGLETLDAWIKKYRDAKSEPFPRRPSPYKPDVPVNREEFLDYITILTNLQQAPLPVGSPDYFFYMEGRAIDPRSIVYMWGDTHGDIQALVKMLAYLRDQKVIDDNFVIKQNDRPTYFVFCGDLTDRGSYGIELLILLTLLKRANPDHVIITRGNHEDLTIVENYGFINELQTRFTKESLSPQALDSEIKALVRFYNSLPVTLFLRVGTATNECLQFMHGAFDFIDLAALFAKMKNQSIGQRAFQIIDKVSRAELLKEWWSSKDIDKLLSTLRMNVLEDDLEEKKDLSAQDLGFLWTDLNTGYGVIEGDIWKIDPKIDPQDTRVSSRGGGFELGSVAMNALLDKIQDKFGIRIVAAFRGHQHNSSMKPVTLVENYGTFRLPNMPRAALFTTVSMGAYSDRGFLPAFLKIALDPSKEKWKLTARAERGGGEWDQKTDNLLKWRSEGGVEVKQQEEKKKEAEVKTGAAGQPSGAKVGKLKPISGLGTVAQWVTKYNRPPKDIFTKSPISQDVFWAHLDKISELQNDLYVKKTGISLLGYRNHFYVAGRMIPQNSIVYVWGDIHGQISSFVNMLLELRKDDVITPDFKINQDLEKTYFVFCGDFVDRGEFGIEVLTLLSILKQNNPDHVIIIRGNHEDLRTVFQYQFLQQLEKRYADLNMLTDPALIDKSFEAFALPEQRLINFYNSLPVSVFLQLPTHDCVQFMHGSVDAIDLLPFFKKMAEQQEGDVEVYPIDALDRAKFLVDRWNEDYASTSKLNIDFLRNFEGVALGKDNKYYKNFTTKKDKDIHSDDLNFVWGDFNVGYGPKGTKIFDPTQTLVGSRNAAAGLAWGTKATAAILDAIQKETAINIQTIFRGHQHSYSMKGLLAVLNHGVFKIIVPSVQNTTREREIFTTVSAFIPPTDKSPLPFASNPTFLKINLTDVPKNWFLTTYVLDIEDNHLIGTYMKRILEWKNEAE